jgi:hypothetical protein
MRKDRGSANWPLVASGCTRKLRRGAGQKTTPQISTRVVTSLVDERQRKRSE